MKFALTIQKIVLLSIVSVGIVPFLVAMEPDEQAVVVVDEEDIASQLRARLGDFDASLATIHQIIESKKRTGNYAMVKQFCDCSSELANEKREFDKIFTSGTFSLEFEGDNIIVLTDRMVILEQEIDTLWVDAQGFVVDDEPMSTYEDDDFSQVTIKQRMRGKFFDRREKRGKLKELRRKKRLPHM